jgi:hypothetical protein
MQKLRATPSRQAHLAGSCYMYTVYTVLTNKITHFNQQVNVLQGNCLGMPNDIARMRTPSAYKVHRI